MEFEDQEEHDEDMELPASYDSLGNTTRPNSGPEPILSASVAGPKKPRYRECLKNHALAIGGQAVDGCGEFMAAGAEGTMDGLKCAACNCHRNFHRKESAESCGEVVFHPHLGVPQFTPYYRTPAGYLQVAPQQQQQYRPLALPSSSGGGGSHSRGEDQEDVSNPGVYGGVSRKRHRTKFTQEQKEKMLGLAERLGWRLQKHDEEVVQQFCNETGVKRQVLKVWMHNNKHTLGWISR
ncbi:zinc-finger homeodomain protein 1-like [Tripterygium wilfordii]|uniref:Zinc-finger homeodomain protein 1-like n=1 Tax=Tripterygium wilfordii TaxID=458696 RepID=A0A7J7CV97_TRIWF|nr:zinc-finger homeodomain protein 1-like [Tripterygium wilfordii]KAF5738020.1 zinc-finger homeodomain protein 1-like [Tripterygium wilfordii]